MRVVSSDPPPLLDERFKVFQRFILSQVRMLGAVQIGCFRSIHCGRVQVLKMVFSCFYLNWYLHGCKGAFFDAVRLQIQGSLSLSRVSDQLAVIGGLLGIPEATLCSYSLAGLYQRGHIFGRLTSRSARMIDCILHLTVSHLISGRVFSRCPGHVV